MIPAGQQLPVDTAKPILRCSECQGTQLSFTPHFVEINPMRPSEDELEGEGSTAFVCLNPDCSHRWRDPVVRRKIANTDEQAKLINDIELYGIAFISDDGRRIHPTFVQREGDRDVDSNGRQIYRPTPILFP